MPFRFRSIRDILKGHGKTLNGNFPYLFLLPLVKSLAFYIINPEKGTPFVFVIGSTHLPIAYGGWGGREAEGDGGEISYVCFWRADFIIDVKVLIN